MLNYRILYVIFILIVYYISTFIISFSLITSSIVNDNPVLLKKYIYQDTLKNNFYNDIYSFNLNYIQNDKGEISIEGIEGKFSGGLITEIVNLAASKISGTLAKDLSSPKTILYFYKKTDELKIYFEKVYQNLGNYSFKKYLNEIQPKKNKNNNKDENKGSANSKKNDEDNSSKDQSKENLIDKINKVIKRYNSTDYFFLINPIYFKIEVSHKEIPFRIFMRFNGYKWKVEKIDMSLQKFIDEKQIKIINFKKKD